MKFFFLIFLSFPVLAGSYRDKSLKKSDIPEFLKKATPHGKDIDDVEYFEKIYTTGKKTYELKFEKDDQEVSVTYSSDGEFLEKEEDIAFKKLPEALKGKIEKYFREKYHGHKILETEYRTLPDQKRLIDIEISQASSPDIIEVTFSQEGEFLSEEKEEVRQIETLN
jgi:hypothetical protein